MKDTVTESELIYGSNLTLEIEVTPVSAKTRSHVLDNLHHDRKLPVDLKFIICAHYISVMCTGDDFCERRILGRVHRTRRSWTNVGVSSLCREVY